MEAIDRRMMLKGIVAGLAVASCGVAFMPKAALSMPLIPSKAAVAKPESLVEEARVVVHAHPRRRHRGRHWRCWWHRGRRVCGWRW
jgi:hypothetical protein